MTAAGYRYQNDEVDTGSPRGKTKRRLRIRGQCVRPENSSPTTTEIVNKKNTFCVFVVRRSAFSAKQLSK